MLPRLVIVEWQDAVHYFGWQSGNDFTDVFTLPSVYSVGWVMGEDETGIKLAQSWAKRNHAQIIIIPKGMVVGITDIQIDLEECQSKTEKSVSPTKKAQAAETTKKTKQRT